MLAMGAAEGEVYLSSYDGTSLPATAGATIAPRSRLQYASPAPTSEGATGLTTGEGASAVIATANGCRVGLGENTRLVFYAERVIHQASGQVELQFPASGRCTDVIVDTPHTRIVGHSGRVSVLSTDSGDWVVAWDGKADVTPSRALGTPAIPLEGHVGNPAAAEVLTSGEVRIGVDIESVPTALRDP